MKLTQNTVSAILSVLLIATTCGILLIGGLSMSADSHNEHSRFVVAASTHN
jgi:hypothetical protein